MTFIANQDIGEFKKGDEVPEAKARAWNAMFANKPCDEVEESIPEPVVPTPLPKAAEVKKADVKKRK